MAKRRPRCGACGKPSKRLVRATILNFPSGARRGLVCALCARLGMLLVLGEDKPTPSKRKARSALVRALLGADPITAESERKANTALRTALRTQHGTIP